MASTEIACKDSYDQFLEFSRITGENWLLPDRKDYVPIGVTKEQWSAMFLKPELAPSVPRDVIRLFEIARGCMLYSWFFYPLATLGAEQCTRIVECAVWARCSALQRESEYFGENLRTLIATGVISRSDEPRWQALRALRNDRSHSKALMLLDPVQAAGFLRNTAEFVNSLFSMACA